ncbi:MAG: hypothetical protein ACXADF_15035 [Candidatus Thorarchaeota archaeon]
MSEIREAISYGLDEENWAECQCGEEWTGRGRHSPTCIWDELQYVAKGLRQVKEKIGGE